MSVAEELAETLFNQERKQNECLRYELFKEHLMHEFIESAIEDCWAVLEVRNIEDWDDRLTEILGEMDKEDRHYIIDVYHKIDG